jgi:endonuclease/exonuclease/phosphatase family metal-dependent hydrolase
MAALTTFTRIKIVNLNLWNGGRLFKEAQDFLLSQNADIYFLQEAYDGHGKHLEDRLRTVELLQQAFPDHHAAFAAGYMDTRRAEGDIEDGNLLLSRWPISDNQKIFTDVPYGRYDQDSITDFSNFPAGFQKARVEIEGHQVALLNVHGPVNLDGTLDTPRRLKFQTDILEHLTECSIVAGDFNVQPATQTIGGLRKKLVSVFDDDRGTSFNLKRKNLEKFPGYATAVVDYFFVTPNIRVLNYDVPQADVSDHLPLVVEVEI